MLQGKNRSEKDTFFLINVIVQKKCKKCVTYGLLPQAVNPAMNENPEMRRKHPMIPVIPIFSNFSRSKTS